MLLGREQAKLRKELAERGMGGISRSCDSLTGVIERLPNFLFRQAPWRYRESS